MIFVFICLIDCLIFWVVVMVFCDWLIVCVSFLMLLCSIVILFLIDDIWEIVCDVFIMSIVCLRLISWFCLDVMVSLRFLGFWI